MEKICVFTDPCVKLSRLTKLSRWVKKHAKFGAEIMATELSDGTFNVAIYQHKTRVDKYGNRYIVETT